VNGLNKKDSQEEKNGIIWEMIKAKIHVASRIPVHDPHPTTVCSLKCLDPLNRRKKTKRDVTDAYKQPRKMIVGIIKEKDTFLYTSSSEPKAGALTYWLPLYA